jgi:hypothetical protein
MPKHGETTMKHCFFMGLLYIMKNGEQDCICPANIKNAALSVKK